LSNNIIQKGLEFAGDWSGTVGRSGREMRFGILPRRPDGRGGASVVRRMAPRRNHEDPMTKTTSKYSGAAKGAGARSKHRKSVRPAARKPVLPQMKPSRAAASTTVASSSQERPKTKQARVIAMLREPAGATMEAMMRATGWQPHSVRGFLAGTVRKKLGLNLLSVAGDSGRTYRINGRTTSITAIPKTNPAA
jgi:hypothetical protein